MKIHYRGKKIKFEKRNIMYAVINMYRDRSWGFADFWGSPYTARTIKKAVQLKKEILEKRANWPKSSFKIIKIET